MNRLVLEAAELAEPRAVELERGEAVVFSRPAPDKTSGNEDAAAVFELQGGAVVLAVADGLGGGPAGAQAASIAMRGWKKSVVITGEVFRIAPVAGSRRSISRRS